jgi:Transposase DDE domain
MRQRRSAKPKKQPKQQGPLRRSLIDLLREFLTPALWRQAHQTRRRSQKKQSSRWMVQPLMLMLLLTTWSHGDSQAERFECAKAFCQLCLRKRRNPGRTIGGFQKALARLPMPVMRTLAAGVRLALASKLAGHWMVEGFIPLGCDGSRIECPRTKELEEHLGQAGKDKSAPNIWVTAVVHLRWGIPWAWRFGKGTASERQHLELLLDTLPRLALLVADAGYFGFRMAECLVRKNVMFLLRMSSNVTLYTRELVRMDRYREGKVYYWPSAKDRKAGAKPLLLRLIRIRATPANKRSHDVWLLTNVMDKKRLSHALAGRMYRWRWQNEGCFRTYKQTLKKVKLMSRTVRLVHREAEGSWLALQLLLAQGVLVQTARLSLKSRQTPGQPLTAEECEAEVKSSPRKILIAIREEIDAAPRPRRRPTYEERLWRARIDKREQTSAKAPNSWPRRKPHKPPGPPELREITDDQKHELDSTKRNVA